MFHFQEKMLKQAQEQAQEKGNVLIGLRLWLLHFFLCQGRFHGEIRTRAFALVSALVLVSPVKFFKTINCKKTPIG